MTNLERVKRLFCGYIYAMHCRQDLAAARRALDKILAYHPQDNERGSNVLSFDEEDAFDEWMGGVVTMLAELEEKGGYFVQTDQNDMAPRRWISYDDVVRSAAGPDVIAELDINETEV